MTEHSKEVMERRRAAFEAWFEESGMYKFKETAWAAWEAALDSVVIELPVSAQHGGEAIDLCKDAIESTGLGLRVK